MPLNVVEGSRACDDRIFAVEQDELAIGSLFVVLSDVSLVCRESNDLVPAELLIADELHHFARVLVGVATNNVLDVHRSERSRRSPRCHFYLY